MKCIFIVSWNSCFNYSDSRTYIAYRAVLKLWYPIFDTHMTATLAVSSVKNSKYKVVFLNWLLEIIVTKPVPLRLK